MEEHIDICSRLDEFVGEDLGVDVFLTRSASTSPGFKSFLRMAAHDTAWPGVMTPASQTPDDLL